MAGVVAALLCTVAISSQTRVAFCLPAEFEQPVNCSWHVDDVSLVWWLIVLGATGLIALLLQPAVSARGVGWR
ncbi:MAG: hypothetical protein WKF73_15000 [Nocardioidaceae bacterium]